MSCRKTSIFFERKPQLCYPYWPISLWLVNVGNYCKCSEYFHKTSHDDSGIDGFLTPSDSQCGWVMHIDRFTSTECLTQVAFFFFFLFSYHNLVLPDNIYIIWFILEWWQWIWWSFQSQLEPTILMWSVLIAGKLQGKVGWNKNIEQKCIKPTQEKLKLTIETKDVPAIFESLETDMPTFGKHCLHHVM